MDLTEKTKKMAEKTRSGGTKKKSKKESKPKGTSLTQYGVTSTKKELREMEWDWLFNLKTKLEKGRPLTLKFLTEGFPLNKLFYTTEAAADVKTKIKSNGNKKPAYTTNNLQLIQLLHASGFKFQHKAKQPAAPPVTPAKPLCPASVTSNDYATFMERVIAKKLKEEAREARKQAKMKAALMESMKKK